MAYGRLELEACTVVFHVMVLHTDRGFSCVGFGYSSAIEVAANTSASSHTNMYLGDIWGSMDWMV